jgi:hypothetical protein
VVMSDGIHDNLSPKLLGIPPRELKLDFDTWAEAEKNIDMEKESSKYRCRRMESILESKCDSLLPSVVLEALMNYCIETTEPGRKWMELNPGQQLPDDYSRYPGKMDHTTCLIHRVGHFEPSSEVSHLFTPLAVSVTVSTTHVRLYCRSIAKGKFECLARRTSCILSVVPRRTFHPSLGEEVIGEDEVSSAITRTIDFPPNIEIDIRTKHIKYESSSGIILIRFERL